MAKRIPAARVSVVRPMRVAVVLSVAFLAPAFGLRMVIAWMYFQAIGRAMQGDLSGVDEARRADALVIPDALAVVLAVVMVTLALQRWREACFANAMCRPDIGRDWMSRTRGVREYVQARRVQIGCYLVLLATVLAIRSPGQYDRQTFEDIRPLFLLQAVTGLITVVTAIGVALIVRRMTSELTTMVYYSELLERRRAEAAGEDPAKVGAEKPGGSLRRDLRVSYRGLKWWQTVLAVLPLGLVQAGGFIGGGIGGAGAAANLSLARKELSTAVKAVAMTCVVAVTYGAGFAAIAAVRAWLPRQSTSTTTQGTYTSSGYPGRPRQAVTTQAWSGPPPPSVPVRSTPAPPLLLNGVPGVDLTAPDVASGVGVELAWRAYTNPSGDPAKSLIDYEVYRSTAPDFVPSQATYIASVPDNATTYTDGHVGTVAPTNASTGAYYYMVVAETKAGLVPGRIHPVRVPTRITLPASAVNMLVSFEPASVRTSVGAAGQPPVVTVGDYTDYAKTTPGRAEGPSRVVLAFDGLSAIPPGSQVTGAYLSLTPADGGDPIVPWEVHALTRSFAAAGATWNRASASVAWTRPGADFGAAAAVAPAPKDAGADPTRRAFDVTGIVRGWIAAPGSAHGLLLKGVDEKPLSHSAAFDGIDAGDPTHTPSLVITYLPAAATTAATPSATGSAASSG